jgi:acetylornithine deacetylase/succinyl-diaminopimelate desuccinylase-like protein
MFKILSPFVFLLFSITSYSQLLNKKQINDYTKSELLGSLNTYKDFLKLPNDGNYPDQINQNLRWCDSTFKKLGFNTQTIVSRGIPHLYAEKIRNKNLPNVLFYLQIDGQPVDPTAWDQEDPFVPQLKDNFGNKISWETLSQKGIDPNYKIFARSASDSKGPAMCFITALKICKEKNISPDFNIKVIMDFQEELSSPTIAELVESHRELLSADRLMIMDGTRHISNIPTLMFGARGIATATLTVYGAKENLHSGQYGNYAPNPAFKLAQLLAGMKDKDGKVTIPGFYDGVLISDEDKKGFALVPENKDSLNQRLGIAQEEKVGDSYQEAMQYPSLNIRGLRSAWVGKEVRTTIPNLAIAEIDMRLIPETPGERQLNLLREYLIASGVTIVKGLPTDEQRAKYPLLANFEIKEGSLPFRTPMESPIGTWLSKAMERAVDKHVKVRLTGGSQPMASFIETLQVPAVSIRIPNPDNNIHGPNENLRVGNYEEGIRMCLAILTQKP